MTAQEDPMPLDAPMPAAEPAPPHGTAESFRLLTARLRRRVSASPPSPPPQPAAADPPPPPPPAAPAPLPQPGEAAAALLDILWGAVDLPPQERSMAGDTLLLLLPRLTAGDLATLAERISAMDQPPPLIVSRLVHDPRPEVGGVLLERLGPLDTSDLLAACDTGEPDRLRMIARRRRVPAAVTDRVVASGDLLSMLALLRNPAAEVSFHAFLRMARMAGEHPGLQAPLALRTDLPLAVAVELLWWLPPELRRVVIARFLSDSMTLGRILSIAHAAANRPLPADGVAPPAEVEAALGPLLAGRADEAARRLALLAGIDAATVERIFADEHGEALVVLLKALGLSRSRFDDALDQIRAATGLLRPDRPQVELKAVFDGLSFTKARVLLTYWDWFTRKAGPYAPAAAPGLVEPASLA